MANIYSKVQAKITARAVIIRFKKGEGMIADFLQAYKLSEANQSLVKAQIRELDPTILLTMEDE